MKTNPLGSKLTRPAIAAISDEIIERKLVNATEGLTSDCLTFLHDRILSTNKENALTICNYITSLKTEINPSDHYRKNTIIVLCKFSVFLNPKPFREMTREDILSFLDSFRKIESVDPLHMWIGTYNLYRIYLVRFFKWMYYPNIEPDKRPKPKVIQNIARLKRKEKSIYKPTDLWTPEDDSLFLKYRPNPRDRCYHAMSHDSAARPHELLKLRIKGCSLQTHTRQEAVCRDSSQRKNGDQTHSADRFNTIHKRLDLTTSSKW